MLNRRELLLASGFVIAANQFSEAAVAGVPKTFDWGMEVPLDDGDKFVKWAIENRGEDEVFLRKRWERFRVLVDNKDVINDANKRAFLLTPRERFVTKPNLPRAYDNAFLDIGFGVTISGPHLVGRMTTTIDVKEGDRVLEVGTGSGYQSAYLSHLTDQVYTIEIIKKLAERTRSIYDDLIAEGYSEFKSINTKNADGYYGWAEAGPFDHIIVTCGIDHVPPPLLQQLKPDGTMVIPVGPPGAQHVLKVTKQQNADGAFTVARSDIYNGRIVPFVPFTKLEGDSIKGTHNGG
ncbi:MAG: protein-L-isoaspartate O-methyltransferase [Aestuariivirga sp.]